jgi:FKBP-type peptidyl-prolyl cis-trans isomerase
LSTDTVKVHYKGTTLDVNEFDSSYSRGEPISFPLNRVIAGWTEGVQLMTEGAKFRFYIPSELAYGAQGAGGSIGPN